MKRPVSLFAILCLVLIQASCKSVGRSATGADMIREFDARSEDFQAAEAAKDIDRIMTYWAPDAVIHFAHAAPVKGTAAIRKAYEGMLPTIASLRAERTSMAVALSGDLAYETGTNYITVASPSGPTVVTSKYLITWSRTAADPWRVTAISVTSNPAQ